MSKTIKMAKLTFVGSTTTSFAAFDAAAATVLPPRLFEQLNEGAAVSERQKSECICSICTIFDTRHVPHLLFKGKNWHS
jgi:hypothetical protein